MSSPTAGDVHVNAPLTNMSIAYIQGANNFIADRVFPNIPVSKQSDRYYKYARGDFNRDEMKERAPGSESAGSGFDLDNTPTYYCPVYGFHKDVHDQIRANEDAVLNSDRDATIFVTQKAMIKRERMFASKYLATNVWDQEKEGAAAAATDAVVFWNDADSTPIEDIRTAKRNVLQATGFEPNKLTLGKAVYDSLVDHPDIIDRIKYGQTPGAPAMVNANSLAQLFEVDEVLVSKAIFNSGTKGVNYTATQTAENSQFISGNHALLCYAAPNAGLMTPSAGYTFSWSGWFGASGTGHRIKRFRMEHLESDRIEIQMAFDQKVTGTDLGYFFKDVIDPTLGLSA